MSGNRKYFCLEFLFREKEIFLFNNEIYNRLCYAILCMEKMSFKEKYKNFIRKNRTLVTIFLAIKILLKKIYLRFPKMWGVLFALSVFVFTTSFSLRRFANDASYGRQIYFDGTDNLVWIEEMNMVEADAESADEADLEKLLESTVDNTAIMKVDPGSVEAGTVIYDDATGKKTTPTFEEDWSLILVNKSHLIPKDYEVELGTIRGSIKCDIRIIDNVLEMIQAAREDGVILAICSPYRDTKRQEMLYNRKAKSYIAKGYSEEEAYELASETVAVPGTSEHELGLAFDFISNNYTRLDAGFADTEAGKWLYNNAADYGFILRYPKDKTAVTDIEFEPWHYRYVGQKAAKEIMSNKLCLEEYVLQIGMLTEDSVAGNKNK